MLFCNSKSSHYSQNSLAKKYSFQRIENLWAKQQNKNKIKS